jgi:hypothetical protein
MNRRYICTVCGVKWFIPWTRPDLAGLMECDACGGGLLPFLATAPAGTHGIPEVGDAEPSPRPSDVRRDSP